MMLQNFVDTLRQGEKGLVLGPNKQSFILKFEYSTADIPANNFLFGFKETVGTTRKPCRLCHLVREDLTLTFDYVNYEKRTRDNHLEILKNIGSLASKELITFQKQTGVNIRSPMWNIPGCTPESSVSDAIHLFLEGGVLTSEVQCFLEYLIIDKKRCSFTHFEKQCDERNQPRKVDRRLMKPGTKPNMTAISFYVLSQELPFMVAPYLQEEDDQHILNYCRVLQLAQFFLWAPVYNKDSIQAARFLIPKCFRKHRELYPHDVITPKFHFTSHLLEQILPYGPSRHQNCFRYGQKYGEFKQKKYRNFLNIPFSLAWDHQKLMASRLLTQTGAINETFLSSCPSFTSLPFNVAKIPD
ncbi:unnamed protein product, partial [Allacma fusca]